MNWSMFQGVYLRCRSGEHQRHRQPMGAHHSTLPAAGAAASWGCKPHSKGTVQNAPGGSSPEGTIKLRTHQPLHPHVVPCKMSQSKNQPCWSRTRVTAQQWCSSKCGNNLAYRLDNFVETEWCCQESYCFLEGAESFLLFSQKSHGI